MSNIIEFPGSLRPRVTAETFVKMRAATPLCFKADIFIFGNGDVGFNLIYPDTKISRRTVAAALRKAAATLDKPRQ